MNEFLGFLFCDLKNKQAINTWYTQACLSLGDVDNKYVTSVKCVICSLQELSYLYYYVIFYLK